MWSTRTLNWGLNLWEWFSSRPLPLSELIHPARFMKRINDDFSKSISMEPKYLTRRENVYGKHGTAGVDARDTQGEKKSFLCRIENRRHNEREVVVVVVVSPPSPPPKKHPRGSIFPTTYLHLLASRNNGITQTMPRSFCGGKMACGSWCGGSFKCLPKTLLVPISLMLITSSHP